MNIEFNVIIAYVVGIILLYIFGRLLLTPLKILIKLIFSAVIGGVVLVVINYIGGFAGIHVPLNAFSALTAGMLGIPGVVLLILLKYVFYV